MEWLIFVVGALVTSQIEDPSILAEIKDTVALNFSRIEDLQIEVDVNLPPSSTTGIEYVFRHQWASKADGKERHSSSEAFKAGTTPPLPKYTNSFNGNTVMTVIFERSDRTSQEQGVIKGNEEELTRLSKKANYQTECLRAWGRSIKGKSLVDWLHSESVKLTGFEEVNGHRCAVIDVEIPDGHILADGLTRKLRFYLSQSHNYALLQYYSYRDGKILLSVHNTSLEEILPGVWFPIEGYTNPRGHMKNAEGEYYEMGTNIFRVLHVEANRGIDDSFFDIEFDPGVPVFDARLNPSNRTRLDRASDVLDGLLIEVSALDSDVSSESSISSLVLDDGGETEHQVSVSLFRSLLGLVVAVVISIVVGLLAVKLSKRLWPMRKPQDGT